MARINGLLISQAISVLFLIYITRTMFAFRFSFSSLKESIKLSFPLIPNQALGMVHGSFDKVMLNLYQGTFSIGYYSFGARFAEVLKMVIDSINKVWEPFFMNLAHENNAHSKQKIVSRFYTITFILMVIGLSVIYFSEEMIKLLTTEEFYPSIYVVPVYVYFYLFAIVGSITSPQISFSEKMIYILPATAVSVIINVGLNLLLIPKYSAIGAAGATALASLFSQMISYYYAMKLFPLPLSKIKLFTIYLITIVYTIMIYPIIAFQINFFLKILLKIVLITTFIFFGIRLNFLEASFLDKLMKKGKIPTMKIVSIIQARMGSSRFPGKVMALLNNKPMIGQLINQISFSSKLDDIILATTNDPIDDVLTEYVTSLGFKVFRGSENNVLSRYYNAAKSADADIIIRNTGDNPLVDPTIIDKLIQILITKKYDYVSNNLERSFPRGYDSEVLTLESIKAH